MWAEIACAVASAAAAAHSSNQIGGAVKRDDPVVIEYPLSDFIGRVIGTFLIVAPIGVMFWFAWPWK